MGLTIHLFTLWMLLCVSSRYFNGVSGQKLTLSLNESDQKTLCTQPLTYGMRYGILNPQNRDMFWFNITLDTVGINLTTMSRQVFFQRNGSDICAVTLSTPCSPTPIDACYCSSQNNQVYNMVYSDYTSAGFVNAHIQIVWKKIDGSFGIASNVKSMPPLYDIDNPNNPPLELTLKLNGQNYTISGQLSGRCSFSLIAGQANKLELIPSKAARPFYMEISSSTSDGMKSSNKSTDYISITVTPANLQVTTEFKLTYSMCVPGNSPLGSCVARTVPRKCCKVHCCRVSITVIVLGCALFVIGVVLATLLCLKKILGIILVKVYTGASSACGAVSLIIGAISTSEYCERICTSDSDHNCCQICEDASLKDCPLGVVSAVLIGACAVTTVLGVALLIYHCCHKKKWKSDFPGGSSSTELATKSRRLSHVAPANHPIDNTTDRPDDGGKPDGGDRSRHKLSSGDKPDSRDKPDGRDEPDNGDKPDGGDRPGHTNKNKNKKNGKKATNEQDGSEGDSFISNEDGHHDYYNTNKRNGTEPQPRTTNNSLTVQTRPLPTPKGDEAGYSTSTTRNLPLKSNFSTIGKTLDSQANRPTSIDGTRQLPQLRHEIGPRL